MKPTNIRDISKSATPPIICSVERSDGFPYCTQCKTYRKTLVILGEWPAWEESSTVYICRPCLEASLQLFTSK